MWDLFFIVDGAEVLKNIKTYKMISIQCMWYEKFTNISIFSGL